MIKVDIIVPVYYALELALRAIDSIIKSEDFKLFDVKIIIVDDTGNKEFSNTLRFLLKDSDFESKTVLITHDQNQGFIEACYSGINYRETEYKVLLNSDTFVLSGWLGKMISLAESDNLIALVNPVTNHSPVIDVPMPPGFNINTMLRFVRNITLNPEDNIDLVTSTGFCLLIKDKYIKKYGFLDRIYGKGYCEETDLYFRYITQGLRAVICSEAFVYHRGEASFTDRNDRYKQNRQILMSRYKTVYDGSISYFNQTTILNRLRRKINEINELNLEVLIFTPSNILNGGGRKILNNICNALNENGISATHVCITIEDFNGIEDRLYQPLKYEDLYNLELRPKIIAFSLTYNAIEVANYCDFIHEKHGYIPKIVHIMQDNEGWFEDNNLKHVKACSNIAASKLIVSEFVDNIFATDVNRNKHKKHIPNTISFDFIKNTVPEKTDKKLPVVCAMMREDQKRGADVIIKALGLLDSIIAIKIKFISFGEKKIKKDFKNIEIEEKGVCSENEVINILSNSDIFLEASYFQGFGMTSIEALLAGCFVISSNNFGAECILKECDNAAFFSIGNSEELKNAILKHLSYKNVLSVPSTLLSVINSRKTYPIYANYFKEVESVNVTPEDYFRSVSIMRKSLLEDMLVSSDTAYKHIKLYRMLNKIETNKLTSKFFGKAKKVVKIITGI